MKRIVLIVFVILAIPLLLTLIVLHDQDLVVYQNGEKIAHYTATVDPYPGKQQLRTTNGHINLGHSRPANGWYHMQIETEQGEYAISAKAPLFGNLVLTLDDKEESNANQAPP